MLQVGAIEVNEPQFQGKCNSTPCSINSIVKQPHIILGHQVFTKGEWKRTRQQEHPRVAITISIDSSEQAKYNGHTHAQHIQAEVSAIADTGAQSDVWSLSDFLAYGFSHDDLLPVNMELSAANRSPISIEGAFFAKLATKSHNGKGVSCCSMIIYVSSFVQSMYLSYESLLNLGVLSAIFSSSLKSDTQTSDTDTSDTAHESEIVSTEWSINNVCIASSSSYDATCSCPQREATPPRPAELPFPCIPTNNERMRAWLLDRYASSTFVYGVWRALQ